MQLIQLITKLWDREGEINVTSVSQYQQSYHPAAQDRLPTEAEQGWAGQYLDGRLLEN